MIVEITMKTKLYLILALLIAPSLCFGRSVHILVITDFEDDTQQISITDSNSGTRKNYHLKMHSRSIHIADNETEYDSLISKLKTILDVVPDFEKKFPWTTTFNKLIMHVVWDNWQITYKNDKVIGDTSIDEVFLYKQD